MTLTMMAAVRELGKSDCTSMEQIAKTVTSGSLRGARGNSGVILSQLFRGFCKVIGSHHQLDAKILASALQAGADTAYKAVMKPKEGTILTVARALGEQAEAWASHSDDILEGLKAVIDGAEEVLQQTPEMLPVLKEAGVVDAGGQGLLYVFRGALMALEKGNGFVLEFDQEEDDDNAALKLQQRPEDIKYGYCTEFIIDVHDGNESARESEGLKRFLKTIGDSIVAVADDEMIKIHVHTNDPGLALQKALAIGSLSNIKIDNMREEHANRLGITRDDKLLKDYGFVVISTGSGLDEIFNSLGADVIVQGGQTMNPSTEDIVEAIGQTPAKSVFVLPNNKNIILAAEQAKAIVEDKSVQVVPSKSVPQGISALISFDENANESENLAAMTEAIGEVKTGQVTYAIRDTSINSRKIKEGDYLGIADDDIAAVEKDLDLTAKVLLESLVDEDSGLITIYYGADVDEADAKAFLTYVESTYPDCEAELHDGGQPIYYYIISVE